MATRNLMVRAGFDASGMTKGTRQANTALKNFGQTANRSMSGLSSTMGSSLGKIGKLLAGVFAVKAIASFGKQCIDLGSDLSEVQNVVDVTFGSMADNINQFSKTAITQFGLSETAAKKYTSTMGAMLKPMGMSQNQIVGMSKAMTGLAADMASFYNLDSEEAFSKIRAGISGETEPLKQLGINMSVANLEAYALAQGMNKAYSKMSQAEQTLLRYNYLMSVTADAQGDFARTSDGWANQTRVLNEQWKAVKATLGQGLINVFTPIVKWLNVIIQRLQVAANAFTNFTNSVFGNAGKKDSVGIVQTTDDMASLGDSAEDTTDSIKKAKGALAGFDEVNTLSKADDVGGTSITDVPTLGMGSEVADMDSTKLEQGLTKVKSAIDAVVEKARELGGLFKQGFNIGFSGVDFSSVTESIQNIKQSLKSLFTDGSIGESFNTMIDSWALNLGKVSGSVASVGTTMANYILGGISKYLEENGQFIKDRFIGMFNISSDIGKITGDFSKAFADVFSVFGGDTAQQINADITAIFVNPFLAVSEVVGGIMRDMLELVTKPFVDNAPKIKEAIENLLEPIKSLTGAIKEVVTDGCEKLVSVYYEKVSPAFKDATEAVSNFVGSLLDGFNTYIAPTLKELGELFSKTIKEKIGPVLEKAIDLFGKICELVGILLKEYVEPLASFLVDVFGPIVSGTFTAIGETVNAIIVGICDVVGGLLDTFTGVTDFLTGVFTGDWERAWEGVKGIFKGIWESIVGILKVPLNLAIAPINGIIDMLNKVKINIPEWLGNIPGMGDIAGQSWGFNIPKIPQLARGGIINSPTIAQVGEAGPEAIVPLENTGFVQAIGDAVSGAVGNAVMNAMQFVSKDTGARNPVFEIDGTPFARAIMPALMKEFNRMGVDLV